MSACRLWSRRLLILACALGLALGIAACGETSNPPSELNDGVYVDAGAITYQLQVSRELNQYSTEDRQYLAGLPAGTSNPSSTELWYGVFLWAKNQTHQAQSTSDNFVIEDSSGGLYYPVRLDSSVNGYAWTQQVLAPSAIEPAPGTTASNGATQGGLLLFKLPTTVYANRPLTLRIYPHGGGKAGEISLDL